MRPIPTLFSLSALSLVLITQIARADTEIRNFDWPVRHNLIALADSSGQAVTPIALASKDYSIDLDFTAQVPERRITLVPSAKDQNHSKWTVRLSWPGSMSTAFTMDVQPSKFNPSDPAVLYIRAAPLSPEIPTSRSSHLLGTHLNDLLLATSSNKTRDSDEWSITARLVFEPLILGYIPRTTLPAIGLILVFAVSAALVVPSILALLDNLSSVDDPKAHAKTD